MKVAILGSCVSRDIFRSVDKDWIVKKYVARQSMIALATAPITLDFTSANEKLTRTPFGKWRVAMVHLCAGKQTFELLRQTDFDLLLVDCIDERCHCLQAPDGRMVTYSPEIEELAAGTDFLAHNGLSVAPGWPYMRHREDALDRFADGLRRSSAGRPIVLHEAYWASRISGSAPSEMDPNYVGRNNDLLELCYAGLKRRLTCVSVGLPRAEVVGCSDHRWGSAAYHYAPDYYAAIFAQLKAISARRPPRPGRARTRFLQLPFLGRRQRPR